MKKTINNLKNCSQQGFVLLDALIAILIFTIGILGMVSLQASAIKLSGDAQNRSNAAMLVDQVTAPMWGNSPTELTTKYAGANGAGGPGYLAWIKAIDCAQQATSGTGCLPGVAANPPTITIDNSQSSAQDLNTTLVTVTINWQAPNDPGPHSYVSITQISL